jgi:hypothetical protein
VVELSPDGSLFATASEDQTARVWDASGLRLLATLDSHAGPVAMVKFDPAGDRLLTVGFDGTARIWNLARDRRAPQEIRSFVACRVPFQLVLGRLVPRSATCPEPALPGSGTAGVP